MSIYEYEVKRYAASPKRWSLIKATSCSLSIQQPNAALPLNYSEQGLAVLGAVSS